MRKLSTVGRTSFAYCSLPLSATDRMGDNGGTNHIMGNVRYSGCSVNANYQSTAIFQTSDDDAASITFCEMPSLRACATTARSPGSKNISRWRSYSRCTTSVPAESRCYRRHTAMRRDGRYGQHGFHAEGWHARLDMGITYIMFFRFAAFPVEVTFLVLTTADAHTPVTHLSWC